MSYFCYSCWHLVQYLTSCPLFLLEKITNYMYYKIWIVQFALLVILVIRGCIIINKGFLFLQVQLWHTKEQIMSMLRPHGSSIRKLWWRQKLSLLGKTDVSSSGITCLVQSKFCNRSTLTFIPSHHKIISHLSAYTSNLQHGNSIWTW